MFCQVFFLLFIIKIGGATQLKHGWALNSKQYDKSCHFRSSIKFPMSDLLFLTRKYFQKIQSLYTFIIISINCRCWPMFMFPIAAICMQMKHLHWEVSSVNQKSEPTIYLQRKTLKRIELRSTERRSPIVVHSKTCHSILHFSIFSCVILFYVATSG